MLGSLDLNRVHVGDCVDVLKRLPAGSIDSVVTDPPYELGFMGHNWDAAGVSFRPLIWSLVRKAAKPGAHMLVFGGTRTFYRIAVAIEDAGWEIRDTIMWVYGAGFPKGLDISKAIDKEAGLERPRLYGVTGSKAPTKIGAIGCKPGEALSNEPLSDDAKRWQGWNTVLKPAWEPIIVARNPLDGTVAANVMKHGTGGINVGECRVGDEPHVNKPRGESKIYGKFNGNSPETECVGRYPANLIHDGSPDVLRRFPETGPARQAQRGAQPHFSGDAPGGSTLRGHEDDGGSAARFFYSAKASHDDFNDHPTIKPLSLMRYLCTLVTPPNGIVLDPFSGSGTTGVAAIRQGFSFLGIERDPHYANDICNVRIENALKRRAQA